MSTQVPDWLTNFYVPEVIDAAPLLLGQLAWLRVNGGSTHVRLWLKNYQSMYYPKSVQYMPKTKRPRKVHYVWADTNNVKCEVHETIDTLYSKWAPDVTCTVCRQLMYNRMITRIL